MNTAAVQPLTAQDMERRYGAFYREAKKLRLDKTCMPHECWPLLPYAELWGISDDIAREDLKEKAPREAIEDLRQVLQGYAQELSRWLAGPEMHGATLSR